MEKANALKHFPCTRHPEETVRKFDPRDGGVQVYCVECLIELDKAATKHLLNIEDYPTEYLKAQSKAKDISGALGPIPKDIEETLTKEKEIKEKLAAHIENEKKKVNEAYDIVKNSFNGELEKHRAEGHKKYEAELTRFDVNYEVLHDNINVCKPGGKKLETMESLAGQINSLANTNDLASFLTHLKNYSEANRAISSFSQEERTEAVQSGLNNICKDIADLGDKKPTTVYSLSRLKHEEIMKKWETSVPELQKDLDVYLADRVQKLSLSKPKIDSKILKTAELDMLVNWLEGRKKFELLYRGTEHGLLATDFHQRCDNKGSTVVLIETTAGERFGGFAELSWGTYSADWYLYSSESFLFSLDLKEKLECITPSQSLYSNSYYGPCWGKGDLVLVGDFLGQEDPYGDRDTSYCYSSLGNNYKKLSSGPYLTGSSTFIVKEIEVYTV